MPIHLVLTAALSLQVPQQAVDQSWGQLARSPHHQGSWRVELAGQTFAGDWAVVSVDQAWNPGATLGTPQRWVHFASSKTADYCAFAIEDPTHLYCRNAATCREPWNCRSVDARLPERTDADAVAALAVPLRAEVQRDRITGSMRTTLTPVTATLAQEEVLFARIHRRNLAATLAATAIATTTQRVLSMPYKVAEGRTARADGFDQTAVAYVATIRIGPSPTAIAIETREVKRYLERCTYAPYHGSCQPQPPTCLFLAEPLPVRSSDANLPPTPAAARR
jgi:hypothetical protein